jgi:hypothetical protein|tara:strand:- start:208 stop:885 length:678 start_codon:yes stop_codon:yes gene_type:complete
MGLFERVNNLFREYGHLMILPVMLFPFPVEAGEAHKKTNKVHASHVYGFHPGRGTDFTDPDQALGPPNAVLYNAEGAFDEHGSKKARNPFFYSVSLGLRGRLTVGFRCEVKTGPGTDLEIGEYSEIEPIYVAVSTTGRMEDFVFLKNRLGANELFSGHPIRIDLNKYGIDKYVAVMVVDSGKNGLSKEGWLGAEVDYVQGNFGYGNCHIAHSKPSQVRVSFNNFR